MLIIRHSEIFTKSEPVVREFVRRLVNNIQLALPGAKVNSRRWRIYVESEDEKEAIKTLQRVFGVHSISPASVCDADIDAIKELVKEKLPEFNGAFAVRTQRISKEFKFTSQHINEQIGAFVVNLRNAKVNLSKPDFKIGIEIYGDKAYLFFERFEGPKGLPLGTARGKVVCDFDSEEDIIAAWMIMKRGAVVEEFPLERWNYVGEVANEVHAKVTGATDLETFAAEQQKTELPLFAPLIGMSKEQVEELKRIVL